MNNINLSEITLSINPLNGTSFKLIEIFSNYGLNTVRVNRYQTNITKLYPNIKFIKSNEDEMFNCDIYIHTSFTDFLEISKKLINLKCQHIISFVKGLYVFNYTHLTYYNEIKYENYDVILNFNISNCNNLILTLDECRNNYNIGGYVLLKPHNLKLEVLKKDQNTFVLKYEGEFSKFMKLHYMIPNYEINQKQNIYDCIHNSLYDLDNVNFTELTYLIEFAINNSKKRIVNHLSYLNTLCALKCFDSISNEYTNRYNKNQIWFHKSERIDNTIIKNVFGNLNYDLEYNSIDINDQIKYNTVINISNDCKELSKLELYSIINSTPILNVEYEKNKCNLDWIIPNKTTFLSKTNIKPEKEFKECVIQNPFHYEHCIKWAINSLELIDKDKYCNEPYNINEIVIYVCKILYFLYEKTIDDIQKTHTLNEVTKKGELYWQFPRKYPETVSYKNIPISFIKLLIKFISDLDHSESEICEMVNNIPEKIIKNESPDMKLFNDTPKQFNIENNVKLIYTFASFRCVNFKIDFNNSYQIIEEFIINKNVVSNFTKFHGIVKAFIEVDKFEKTGVYNNYIIQNNCIEYIPNGPKHIKSCDMDPIMLCPIISIPENHTEWDCEIFKNITIEKIIEYIQDKYNDVYISDIYIGNQQLYPKQSNIEFNNIEGFVSNYNLGKILEMVIIANDKEYNLIQLPNFIYIID